METKFNWQPWTWHHYRAKIHCKEVLQTFYMTLTMRNMKEQRICELLSLQKYFHLWETLANIINFPEAYFQHIQLTVSLSNSDSLCDNQVQNQKKKKRPQSSDCFLQALVKPNNNCVQVSSGSRTCSTDKQEPLEHWSLIKTTIRDGLTQTTQQ